MKYQNNTEAKRGQTIRQDFGRDRSDDHEKRGEEMNGSDLKGSRGDLSHSIKDGKVPEE